MLTPSCLLTLALAAGPTVQKAPEASEAPHSIGVAETPRLVVLILVDQMIPEQLERLRHLWRGGFHRLAEEGRVFRAARLGYARSETGPGHATCSTGVYPSRHGIIGNGWYGRDEKRGIYCFGDADTHKVNSATPADAEPGDAPETAPASAASPRNLKAPTLSDHLRARWPGSKTCSIAGKDRSAVGLAGKQAELVLWWDLTGDGFVSSSWYEETLPGWVTRWNETWTERASGHVWDLLEGVDLSGTGTAPDQRPGEAPFGGTSVFPHTLPVVGPTDGPGARRRLAGAVRTSPLVDAFSLELARQAVVELELGLDDDVDLLSLSLTTCDVLGHYYGPMSMEVTDGLLRTDRELEALFALLDERVGEGRYLCALSSDHGVLELPESLREGGVGAERLPMARVTAVRARLEQELQERFGTPLVQTVTTNGVYLDHEALRAAELEPREVRAAAAGSLADVRWLERVYTLEELTGVPAGAPDSPEAPDSQGGVVEASTTTEADGWLLMYQRSFDPERGPDLRFQRKPWTIFAGSGTTHGSPYPYDQRIPLIFHGPGFEAAWIHDAPAGSVDVVPTLLEALGVELPEGTFDGRVLPGS